jgi:alanyl aminopeptidase
VKSRDRWYAFTQFEAVDARRAFPCFDEPAFKIPWELVLRVPAETIAVANAPQREETVDGGTRRVRFQQTRPLPSYLVAFAVGEFDVVTAPPLPPNEVRSWALPIRGLAVRGRGAELAYALRAGADLLVMIERWFGTPFPFEKLDHVAVPDFEAGAMENAGLITYREPGLLVDERSATDEQKLVVVVDMAHEIAHQWFGDLVTMAWWDDLWLNESFADFVETKFTDAYRPESSYPLVHAKAVHRAMLSEELSMVHPIRPVLETEGDIFGFDYGIVYWKGGAVIAMFEQFLGPERFRTGIRRYLDQHRDGNATRDDLVAALSAQGADVGPALRSFIEQPGLPLLQAELRCESGPPRVTLRQTRQLPLGSPAQQGGRWEIPVCVRTSETRERPDCVLLRTERAELPLTSKTCPAWFALNPGGSGYYRWTLPGPQLQRLLQKGYASLRPAERLALASNLTAAFRSGALSAEEVLAALEPFARDPEPAVAQEPAEFLKLVQDRFVDPAQRPRVQAYLRSLYAPVLARIGWKSRPGEPERMRIFRPWLIDMLAFSARDSAVLTRAAALGTAYLGTDSRLHPEAVEANLVEVALRAAGRLGSPQRFETMLQRLWAAEDSNVRQALLGGLSQFTEPGLGERARALALDDRLRVNERGDVLHAQVAEPDLRPAAWEWVKTHLGEFAHRLPETYVQFLAFAQRGCGEADAEDLERSLGPEMEAHAGARYTLAKAAEATRVCGALAEHHRASVARFFAGTGPGRRRATLH